jgi:hypothetical protein
LPSFGHIGKKIGNAHLRWAFDEAAVLMLKGPAPASAPPPAPNCGHRGGRITIF